MRYRNLENSYLSSFCLELNILLQAGIAPSDGISMLYEDETDKDGKALLKSLLNSLEAGDPLSVSLRESGNYPVYMVNMVEIGERTGRLTDTLKALSEYYDRQDRLSTAIRNAIMYPVILLFMMVVVVIILITQVLPIFNDVFIHLGIRMSSFATSLMNLGGWLIGASAFIAAVIGALIIIALALWFMPTLRKNVSRLFKNIHGNRGISKKIEASHFISAMALAVASGLDIVEAAEMAASVSGGSNPADIRNLRCIEALRSGESLQDVMLKNGIISSRNSRILAIGVRGGMTDSALYEIAAKSERDVQEQIDRAVGMIEPSLVITASVIVGLILFSVMLPLVSIMTSVG